jgi:hypothetical protein
LNHGFDHRRFRRSGSAPADPDVERWPGAEPKPVLYIVGIQIFVPVTDVVRRPSTIIWMTPSTFFGNPGAGINVAVVDVIASQGNAEILELAAR